jgi:CRP-like cAMP-binding protein
LQTYIYGLKQKQLTSFLRQHIEQIVKLSNLEFEVVESCFSIRKLRKRQFLIQEYQPVNEMYLVKSGLLKTGTMDDIGKEHILQFAAANWWISDFAAFYKQQNATLAVDCIEASELFAITFEDLQKLCVAVPRMEHFFRVKSNMGYVALQQRILSLMSKTARQRYDDFLKQYPGFAERIPKQLIASYLGVSRETLSRL